MTIAGGVAASANPEVCTGLFDAVIVGEADTAVEEITDAIIPYLTSRADRETALERLAATGYVYVPEGYEFRFGEQFRIAKADPRPGYPAKVAWRREMHSWQPAFREAVGRGVEFGEHFLIEISRGCPFRCRFCLPGNVCGAQRDVPLDVILQNIEKSRSRSAALVAPLPSAHRAFRELLHRLVEKGVSVTVSSLRVEDAREDILALLAKSGMRTLTLAPETGNEILRRKLGKLFKNEEVIEAAVRAEKAGFRNVKLYFMVGFPGETPDHVKESVEFVVEIKSRLKRARLSVGIAPFVPKPHTPLERQPMKRVEELQAAYRLWKKVEAKGIRLSSESIKSSLVQALLSTGGRWVAEFVTAAARENPSRALKKHSVMLEQWVYRPKEEHEILPWHFIRAR